MHLLRQSRNLKIPALVEEEKIMWGITLGRFKAYRAKVKALNMIHGASVQQYMHLRNYAEELLRSKPESTMIIKSSVGQDSPVFERIYICFQAVKIGFSKHCRPLICLDGLFLREYIDVNYLLLLAKMETTKCFQLHLLL